MFRILLLRIVLYGTAFSISFKIVRAKVASFSSLFSTLLSLPPSKQTIGLKSIGSNGAVLVWRQYVFILSYRIIARIRECFMLKF